MNWWRAHHGISHDPKLALVAKRARAKKCEVLAVWISLLDYASQQTERGTLAGVDHEEIAFQTDISIETVQRIMGSLHAKDLVNVANRITAWEKRQYSGPDDNSTDRVRAYRERVRKGGSKVGGYLKHWNTVFERDGGVCVYCGSQENLCLDHGVPVAQGGDDDPMNLYLACKRCNSGKSGRTPEQAGYKFTNANTREIWTGNLSRMSPSVTVTETPVTPVTHQNRTDTEQIQIQNRTQTPKPLRVLPWPKDFDFEVWFAARLAKHPIPGRPQIARGYALDKVWVAFKPADFDAAHDAWCAFWIGRDGGIPSLATFIFEDWWKRAPPKSKSQLANEEIDEYFRKQGELQ